MGGSHHPFMGLSPAPPFENGHTACGQPTPTALRESWMGWVFTSPHPPNPTPHPAGGPRVEGRLTSSEDDLYFFLIFFLFFG